MTAPSNEKVGKLLGVSHATVSRYRSGDRLPNIDVMGRIARILGWSMDDQYRAREAGSYATEFTLRVSDEPTVGAMGQTATTNQ